MSGALDAAKLEEAHRLVAEIRATQEKLDILLDAIERNRENKPVLVAEVKRGPGHGVGGKIRG